ncbi:MAG: hypothetical protein BAJALOKI2v1_70012 [Promethearchaeota archaeon]|nr:MAG: hypothetical protein BAJALOKI2v1_70012 [Candidatus Lokiarchaeota archaeon]
MNEKEREEALKNLKKHFGPMADFFIDALIEDREAKQKQKKRDLERLKQQFGPNAVEILGIKDEENTNIIFADSPEEAAEQSMAGFANDFFTSMLDDPLENRSLNSTKEEVIFMGSNSVPEDGLFQKKKKEKREE